MLPPPPAGRAFDVVGVGATSVDFVYMLPEPPAPSASLAKIRINHHFVSCGGQMATSLATCAALGLRAKLLGVMGSDDNANRIRRELTARGVDVADVVVRDAPNPYAVILVDERSGERIVLWDRDEQVQMRDGELRTAAIGAGRMVHVDDVDVEASIRAANAAREAGVPATSDIDRLTNRTMDLVRAVTIPIFAEHVPAGLTGIDDPAAALRALRNVHDGLLCVTLGVHGAIALDGDRLHHAPAFEVAAVDTTGAGDVFRGAFIYAHLHAYPVPEALRFANAAAAVSCTRLGAMASAPSLEDAERLLATGQPVR
jgi:sugar/nucleoside kinase (ribokinase family)